MPFTHQYTPATDPANSQLGTHSIASQVIIQVSIVGPDSLQLEITRVDNATYIYSASTIRVYYLSAKLVSPLLINNRSPVWYQDVQAVKVFVTELSLTGVQGTIITIPFTPYKDGGWFFAAVVLPSGRETRGSDPVPVPSKDAGSTAPDGQVLNVAVDQRNVNGIIELTFKWQLPNPLPASFVGGHVQPWIYNYGNTGKWREGPTFDIRAITLQYEQGTMLYYPDYDGLHNVTIWFVVSNSGRIYDPAFSTANLAPYLNRPAASVVLVGGIGP